MQVIHMLSTGVSALIDTEDTKISELVGGPIEATRFSWRGSKFFLFSNEHSVEQELPLNFMATTILSMTMDRTIAFVPVLGDCVVTSGSILNDGDLRGLDDKELKDLIDIMTEAIGVLVSTKKDEVS